MNRKEEILHQKISEAWNNTHLYDHPEKQRLFCIWTNAQSKQYGNKMRTMGVKPGISDWAYMNDNGSITWIELKTEEGHQSPDQIKFQNLCVSLGHQYKIARSYSEFWECVGIEVPIPEDKLLTGRNTADRK